MNKRLRTIKRIDKELAEITASLNKLIAIRDRETDKTITRALNEYILLVAYLDYKFSVYLMSITSKSVEKDYIDKEFKRIMKDLFKNGK